MAHPGEQQPGERPKSAARTARNVVSWVWRNKRKALGLVATIILATFLLIQLVPYGRDHENPAVRLEPTWNSPRTRNLAVKACFDCHSNEVIWPWYSNVAPLSWIVQSHVDEGRRELNFSEWDLVQDEADEAVETIREGSMPPWYFTLPGTGRQLSSSELDELARGLELTLRASGYPQEGEGGGGRAGEDEDDDD